MAGECCEITAENSTVTVCRHKNMLFCPNLLHERYGKQSIILSISPTIAFSKFPNNTSCGDATNFTRCCGTVAHLEQNTAQPLPSSLQHNLVLPALSYTLWFLDLLFISWRTPNEKVQLWAHQVRLVCPSSCNIFKTGEQISIKYDTVSLTPWPCNWTFK